MAAKTAVKVAPKAVKAVAKVEKVAKPKGLGKTQRLVLVVLSKAKGPMTRKMIAAKAGAAGNEYAKRNARVTDEKGTYAALVAAKLVKFAEVPVPDRAEGSNATEWTYEITAAGRKAVAK